MPPKKSLPQRSSKLKKIYPGPGETQTQQQCSALSIDGTECRQLVTRQGHQYCRQHHAEYKKLYGLYKDAEARYSQLGEPETANEKKDKMALGKISFDLRTQVNHRFFSHTLVGNRGHIQRILKLGADLKALQVEDRTVGEADVVPGSENHNPDDAQIIYHSLANPSVPASALVSIPESSPVKVIRKEVIKMNTRFREQLYAMVPSLDDSDTTATVELDEGDLVMRLVFRRFVLERGDSEALSIARRTKSIDEFLRKSSNVLDYVKFFNAFGRMDTLHYLRDAVCDYLLSPDVPSVTLLGHRLATSQAQCNMTVKGWDILYTYFWDIVNWANVFAFCVRSQDMSLITKLTALLRYGTNGEENGWLQQDEDVAQECSLAALQGFVGVNRSDTPPLFKPMTKRNAGLKEQQVRCYLSGWMSKSEPLAQALVQEMVRRLGRYIVIVYDMESSEIVAQTDDIEDIWITRSRITSSTNSSPDAAWNVEWSFKDVRLDVDRFRSLALRYMSKDYYEFIIIYRDPDKDFELLNMVADALLLLAGDPSVKELSETVVKATVPLDEQQQWLEAFSSSAAYPPQIFVSTGQYEGSRVRAWGVATLEPEFPKHVSQGKRTREDVRLIVRTLADMEAKGLIRALKEYDKPHCCPAVTRSSDGLGDIYFDYPPDPRGRSSFEQSAVGKQSIISSYALVEFARRYKARHPHAIFAKGTLHVHYCAWPMPVPKTKTYGNLTFMTPPGHLFQWNVMPFDFPYSTRVWQYYVNCEINYKVKFAHFMQTTFVICAASRNEADANTNELHEIADKHDWKLSIPSSSSWTSDLESLDLETLWSGIYPAGLKKGPV